MAQDKEDQLANLIIVFSSLESSLIDLFRILSRHGAGVIRHEAANANGRLGHFGNRLAENFQLPQRLGNIQVSVPSVNESKAMLPASFALNSE